MPETQTESAEAIKWVPIDRIIESPLVQVRVSIDTETVKDYEAIIIDAGGMDPLTGWRIEGPLAEAVPPPNNEGSYFLLSAGGHRLRAYRNLGKTAIPMRIKSGSLSEALEDAIVSNCRHGKRFTNEDKRKAAEMAVRDPVLGQRNDEWIAKRLGVSQGFIATVRRGITPEDRKRKAERKQTAASGKRESESPAPRPATTRERKDPTEADRPTAAKCMKQIEDWIFNDVIDEAKVVASFSSATGKYHWAAKEKKQQTLKIVNRAGLSLLEIPVLIQSINEQEIVVSASMRDMAKARTSPEEE